MLAGVNGAGKSSVGGALLQQFGLTCFNPDRLAREERERRGLSQEEANAFAWAQGVAALRDAIGNRTDFAFETTLGGTSIPALLQQGAATHDLRICYCGLGSVEQHLERVALRVRHGGHPIAESKIRERWVASPRNLIGLLPVLAELQVFDNSQTVAAGAPLPSPRLLLHWRTGAIVKSCPSSLLPAWTAAIMAAARALER